MTKSKIYLSFSALIAASCVLSNCKTESKDVNSHETSMVKEEAVLTNEQLIERGAYLVKIMGCNDCHSPKKLVNGMPVPDENLLLSGHPAALKMDDYDKKTANKYVLFNMINTATIGPWGTSYAANITSDETGIGNWTEEQFTKAMKEGKYKGLDNSRILLPPMPWVNYSQMKEDDIKAIFNYLKSTKPVSNNVPAPTPPSL